MISFLKDDECCSHGVGAMRVERGILAGRSKKDAMLAWDVAGINNNQDTALAVSTHPKEALCFILSATS